MNAVIGKAEFLYRHNPRENMVRCACGHAQKIAIWSWAGHGFFRCKSPACRAKIMYGSKQVIDDRPVKTSEYRTRIDYGINFVDLPTEEAIRIELKSVDGDSMEIVADREKLLKGLERFLKKARGQ